MVFLCCCQTVPESSSRLKDLLPLVSPIIVIILFIIDRVIGFRLRRKEVERNWYLKVLIEPGVSKISDFYKKSVEFYTASANTLGASSALPHANYNVLKAQEFSKFQSLKRELEAEVIFPIQMRYPVVGQKLTELLLDIEDTFTSSLDREEFSEDKIKDFQIYTATNRAELLNCLYFPLKP